MPQALNITIIGAGIAGLSTGISLSKHGHHVRILEANSHLAEFGAGIQLSPNATRILCKQWGLRRAFESANWVHHPTVQETRRYNTGEIISTFGNDPNATEELYGSPYVHSVSKGPGTLTHELMLAAINAGLADNSVADTGRYVDRTSRNCCMTPPSNVALMLSLERDLVELISVTGRSILMKGRLSAEI